LTEHTWMKINQSCPKQSEEEWSTSFAG